MTFLQPALLWLLVLPVFLMILWFTLAIRRLLEVRAYRAERVVPLREKPPLVGTLGFWLFLILACACIIVAVARPQAVVDRYESSAVDFIVLIDGSTSMRVTDVSTSRWQRATEWLRVFAESLSWEEQRVALALFASRPAPQIRLTSDPNAFFFFLDHLSVEPPFRVEDIGSWDTNIEQGIFWALKMIDVDEELYGSRRNPKALIVISDGQAWSGEVQKSIELARSREVRVHVIGVGSSAGGLIPNAPQRRYEPEIEQVHSRLDRASLREIADEGRGEYFELGSQSDRAIALDITSRAYRSSPIIQTTQENSDLYWFWLLGAAIFYSVGLLWIREEIFFLLQITVGLLVFLSMNLGG